MLRSLVRPAPKSVPQRPTAHVGAVTTRPDTKPSISYAPHADGDADPGEVVWTWVPYEDDPSQGKDRPVLVIGRAGQYLGAVALTSKGGHWTEMSIGTGPWDRGGRESFVKLDRVLRIDPAHVRREGAVLDRARFDRVIAGLRAQPGN